MPATADKKRSPKKVAPIQEAQEVNPADQPINHAAINSVLMSDPTLSDIRGPQAPKPECAPMSETAIAQAKRETARRRAEASVDLINNGKNGSWTFVKNGVLKEKITFKDGTAFQAPDRQFTIKDEEQAKKILEVADIYNIVLK